MDPITVGLLAALAGGAGGELGRQAWAGLGALVRRPFHRAPAALAEPGSGEAEFAALQAAPANQDHAAALSTALAHRAALDPQFGTELAQWHEQARLVHAGDSWIRNEVSGGTITGPVFQGRDFSGLTITSTPPQPPADPAVPPRES